jgi:hypothetical protein
MLKSIKKSNRQPILLEIVEEPINTECDYYTIARSPYIKSEFIPSNIIPIVMKHFFESSELVLSYNDNHSIYKIMIKDLLVDTIQNWKFNRPPDMARCPDIATYIYNSKKPVDTMLYLSFNNIKEVFEVLDGIHRITALKMIKDENSKPFDPLVKSHFGSDCDAAWLYNQYLLVNIRFNASKGELVETFENLNKSQVVPEIYFRDYGTEKRDIINTISNEWFVKYKKHFSSSANPITGHTNKNKFEDLLDKLYDKHKIRDSSSDKLRRRLDDANKEISMNIPSKASIDIRVKCRETGCYLFLYKNDKLEEFI